MESITGKVEAISMSGPAGLALLARSALGIVDTILDIRSADNMLVDLFAGDVGANRPRKRWPQSFDFLTLKSAGSLQNSGQSDLNCLGLQKILTSQFDEKRLNIRQELAI